MGLLFIGVITGDARSLDYGPYGRYGCFLTWEAWLCGITGGRGEGVQKQVKTTSASLQSCLPVAAPRTRSLGFRVYSFGFRVSEPIPPGT